MKIVLFANTDWYLYNFRRALALALKDRGYDVLLISPPGPYGQQLQALGLRWLPVPMDRRSLNPFREARLLVWLHSLFRKERPDLVHGFTIKCAIYGSLAARLAGVPARVNAVAGMGYVFTSADLKARLLRPLVRGLMHAALGGRTARLILQNPDDVAQLVDARLVSASAVRLIPSSGVDCARFNPQSPDRPDADQRIRVVLVARLLRHKGLFEFVEASRLLSARGRAIEFVLAGTPDDGNPDSVDEQTVQGWVNAGLVKWLGHVDDVSHLLRSCNVMALPSYYGEGLPRSLIEASASGLALITTDMPGCRQAIDDGVTGLMIPPRNAEALADAIETLDVDRALTKRMGEAARQKALAEFDERLVIDRTISVYDELLH
ncbi:glycosyltransferase family 4 protein [Luteimonas fraxinea]|uniref:Glycosyltransferase family 4 protein n=1 Tax=Luteimonas fraxinea TaxID=2901869 RepID=A0ABS8UG29_9GAMM|nr:glycosyltransferase family 4 protein [Luteimonas fraxinea]MCD9097669.1 glycosyltransferase family 4 protein [Luteimonas fraxinea]MCD9124789.1 glycosyltransferase family 4 protein [Luteimonas fraxinea]UHH08568.1 glycosyltransferase family 4 protein [Luteimonas fraxinea]